MQLLNTSYIKRFITKSAKETGANINIIEISESISKFTFTKNNVYFEIIIKPCSIKKYDIVIRNNIIYFNTFTDNLSEVIQCVDLILVDFLKYATCRQYKAVIKANHWKVKLITVERPDGYRANLYLSHLLYLLIMAGFVKIDGLEMQLDVKTFKVKCKYNKDVLDYDKIQKEQSWDKYSKGFKKVQQYPNGNDYIHPSITWQKGKLF